MYGNRKFKTLGFFIVFSFYAKKRSLQNLHPNVGANLQLNSKLVQDGFGLLFSLSGNIIYYM